MNNVLSEEQEHLLDLPAYLAKAGMAEDLFDLLTDFEFIEAKISAVGTRSLIEDYDLVRNLNPPQPPLTRGEQENTPHRLFNRSFSEEGQGGDLKEKADTLKLIQGAIRLSAHVVDKDKTQLAGQLLGRLMSFKAPGILALLAQSKQKQKPWLRPFTPSLMPPGTPLLRTLTGHSRPILAVAITPNGEQVVSASWDNTLKVWDLHSGAEQLTLTAHSSLVLAVAITPNGKHVVSASGDNTLKVWDLHSGAERLTLTGHSNWVEAVAITPDGKQVLSASWDNTLKVWDLHSGAEQLTLTAHSSLVLAVAITPDGRQVVSASDDNTLKVWHLQRKGWNLPKMERSLLNRILLLLAKLGLGSERCSERLTLTGHSNSVRAVAITPDGQQVVSASYDNTLKVWDLHSGAERLTLTGHSNSVRAVAITPNGKQVVSASSDNTLKVWDLESGTEIASFSGDGALYCCAVAPDGVTIVAGEASGRVHFLRLEGVARRG
jgi:WD40 repeat protein